MATTAKTYGSGKDVDYLLGNSDGSYALHGGANAEKLTWHRRDFPGPGALWVKHALTGLTASDFIL